MATVRKTLTKRKNPNLSVSRKYTCGFGPYRWKLHQEANGWYTISEGQVQVSLPPDILVGMANETIRRRRVFPPRNGAAINANKERQDV